MPSSPIPAARCHYLLDLLAQVPDPRKRRGRRYALAGLLATGIAAVIAGSRSFAAIGQWAAGAGPEALAVLGAARGRDLVFARRSGRRRPGPAGKGLPMPGTAGQRAVRDDSARRATTFSTSRRIALLPGRMTCQYAAKARLVFGSVARTRVSVLSKVPAETGSRRNSIPALIHPGSDHARRAAASRYGGTDPPSRRQAWLRPAEITT